MNEIEISSVSAIEHILMHRSDRIREILIDRNADNLRIRNLIDRAKTLKIPIGTFTHHKESHEPLRAKLGPYPYKDLKHFVAELKRQEKALVIALDHVQDPQNFGAICRTAEGLGVSAIVIPKDRGCLVTSGVYHSSVGAVETIPIIAISNLQDTLRRFKDEEFWILTATLDPNAQPLEKLPQFKKIVLVLGAEGKGISALVEKLSDWKIKIPLSGKVQSLNVSASAAILVHTLMTKI